MALVLMTDMCAGLYLEEPRCLTGLLLSSASYFSPRPPLETWFQITNHFTVERAAAWSIKDLYLTDGLSKSAILTGMVFCQMKQDSRAYVTYLCVPDHVLHFK